MFVRLLQPNYIRSIAPNGSAVVDTKVWFEVCFWGFLGGCEGDSRWRQRANCGHGKASHRWAVNKEKSALRESPTMTLGSMAPAMPNLVA
jgi:hypothetical protein